MAEKRNTIQYVGMGIFVFLVFGSALFIEQSFLEAFIWGGVLSITAHPLFAACRRRGWGAHSSAALISVAIFGLVAVPLTFMVVKAVAEVPSLYEMAHTASENGIPVPESINSIPKLGPRIASLWTKYLADPAMIQHWSHTASHVVGASGAKAVTHKVMEAVETTAIAILSVYFFLVSSGDIAKRISVASKRFLGGKTDELRGNIVNSIRGTVSGLVLVGLGEGVIIGVGYFLLGTPHPALFTLATAVISVIPFCGPVILTVAALITFMSAGVIKAVIVAVVGMVAYFVGDHFVRPQLISGNTKIPFLAVLTAIIGGLHEFGLIGLFICPAMIAVAFSLWRSASSAQADEEI